MKRLGLFVFIDAFGWEVLQRHPQFLAELAPERRPLETILGYSSACDPSIISGLSPAEHGLWSSYYYVPGGDSPFAWTRWLGFLPEALTERARVRHYLSRLVKKVCGIRGYFQLYNVPFRLLPLFHYAEWKRIWEPGGLPRGQSIFDLLQAGGKKWHVHDSGKSDEGKLGELQCAIRAGEISLAYISLGKLDALMHAEGTHSRKIDELVKWYDGQVRGLVAAAASAYDETALYVFTDHGMHDVVRGYDLQRDVEALGLGFAKDYVAFYDSTMARFWSLNPKGRARLEGFLEAHPEGRLLADEELKRMGVFFPDAQYGDLIFLMNSGVQIAPSFMGRKAIRGMHGFDPSDADSKAMICSNRPLPDGLRKIQDIFGLMREEVGI